VERKEGKVGRTVSRQYSSLPTALSCAFNRYLRRWIVQPDGLVYHLHPVPLQGSRREISTKNEDLINPKRYWIDTWHDLQPLSDRNWNCDSILSH
jgi:hypothetical protein